MSMEKGNAKSVRPHGSVRGLRGRDTALGSEPGQVAETALGWSVPVAHPDVDDEVQVQGRRRGVRRKAGLADRLYVTQGDYSWWVWKE